MRSRNDMRAPSLTFTILLKHPAAPASLRTRNFIQLAPLIEVSSSHEAIPENTFAYTAIKDWNSLPSRIKEINSEKLFKEKVKKHLVEISNKEEREDFKRD